MPSLRFTDSAGVERIINAPAGITLMEAARQHGIAGVVAQCGGACACATCHVYIAAEWIEKLEPPEDMELGMLETAWDPRANSRLSCQIHLTNDLDGMQVAVPARQC